MKITMKFNKKSYRHIFRQISASTKNPIFIMLIPVMLVLLQFSEPWSVLERIFSPVAVAKSDTLQLNHFFGLRENIGRNVNIQADTTRVSENATDIKDGRGGGTLIIQRGQNYFDPAFGGTGAFRKRDLNPRAVRSVDAHVDTFDYEVRDNLHRRFNKKLTQFSVTDESGNFVEYAMLGVGNVRSEAVVDGNRARASIDANYDVVLTSTPEGIKEEIILLNSSAPVQFRYRIQTNLDFSVNPAVGGTGVILFEDVFFSNLVAHDANGNDVPLSLDIIGSVLTIDADVSSAVFPVVIDPSLATTFTSSARFQSASDTWANMRDATSAFSIQADEWVGARRLTSSTGNVYRSGLIFDMSALPSTAVIDSVVMQIWLAGWAGVGQTTVSNYILEGTFTDVTTEANYNNFVGWASSGAYDVSDSLASITYDNTEATAEYKSIKFNAAGVAYIESEKGESTTAFMFISGRDAADDDLDNDSDTAYLDWDNGSNATSLTIYYSILIMSNDSLNFRDSTTTRVTAFIDTSLHANAPPDSFRLYLASDSTTLYGVSTGDTSITTADTLTPNTFYNFIVAGVYAGNDSIWSPVSGVWTRIPVSGLVLSDTTHRAVTVTFDSLSWRSVLIDSYAVFLNDGVTRISAFSVDTVFTIDSLTSLVNYSLLVKAFVNHVVQYTSESVSFTSDSLPVPYSFAISSNLPGETIISVTDSSGSKNLRMVFYDTLGVLSNDTVSYDGVNPNTILDTVNTSSFPDSLVAFKVLLLNSQGDSVSLSKVLENYMQVAFPLAVISIDTSDTTIQIYFDAADINPDRVFYQLYDSAQSVFVNISGDTSATDTSWAIKSSWDTLTIDVGVNSEHLLFLKGRNSDSVATTYSLSDSLWSWAQIPDMISAFPHSRDSILIQIDPKQNPAYTYFAIEDSVSGLFLDYSSNTLRSSGVTADSTWAWATYAEWGGAAGYYVVVSPNTSFIFRAYAKDGIKRN